MEDDRPTLPGVPIVATIGGGVLATGVVYLAPVEPAELLAVTFTATAVAGGASRGVRVELADPSGNVVAAVGFDRDLGAATSLVYCAARGLAPGGVAVGGAAMAPLPRMRLGPRWTVTIIGANTAGGDTISDAVVTVLPCA